MISAAQARDAVEQYRDEGYAVVRGFVDGDDLIRLQKESQAVYDEGLKHHATYRHGNLNFQILPEAQFGKRYVLQAYWFSWINRYFEEFRRNPDYLKLLEGLIGRDIKQIAQQLHWKPPGANVTGYRFHQDLRFRNQSEYDTVTDATVTTGLAVDRATKENGCLQVVPKSHKRGYLGLSDEGHGQLMKGLTAEEELTEVGIDPSDIIALELEPGDLLVLFTDGLVEDRARPIKACLEDLALASLQARDQTMGDAVDHLVASAGDRSDDLALVCLRRTAPPAS